MSKIGRGRPKSPIERIPKYFKLRVDHAMKLETYPNQTKILDEALDMYFEVDESSTESLIIRKKELELELNSVIATIDKKKMLKEEKSKSQEKERVLTDIARQYININGLLVRPDKSDRDWIKKKLWQSGLKDVTIEEFLIRANRVR